jgi:quinol monooxygenase YgiN
MIHVIATIRVKPGKMQDFLEPFEPYAVDVRKEKGCIRYGATLEIDAGSWQPVDKGVVRAIETCEGYSGTER